MVGFGDLWGGYGFIGYLIFVYLIYLIWYYWELYMVEVVYVIIVIWGFIVLMRVGGSLGVRYGVVVFLYVIVGV